MKKEIIWRGGIYIAGIVVLALGVALGTKTGMGVSPINSIPFAVTNAFGWDFAIATFIFYSAMILLQFLLRGKHRRWRDLLQLPFSMAFSAMLGLFENTFPVPDSLIMRLIVLVFSILLLGLGVVLVVNMRIAPNPADGLADTIGWKIKKDIGLGKNILDACCVVTAFVIDIVFGTAWTSIGVATVVYAVLTGRSVHLFNRLLRKNIFALAGLKAEY